MWRQYVDLGMSVLPLYPHSKNPHGRMLMDAGYVDEGVPAWGLCSQHIPDRLTLDYWFGDGQINIGIVAGEVSGNLVHVDFDSIEAYRVWALAHKEFVNATAVQKTMRGYHVFFRVEEPSGGDLYFEGAHVGEVRGNGMYVVGTPSFHPNGKQYEWLRHPKDGIVSVGSLSEVSLYVPKSFSWPTLPLEFEPDGEVNEEYIDIARRTACSMIANAGQGEKHTTLLRASVLLGGYVAGHFLVETEAIKLLETEIKKKKGVESLKAAQHTIRSGLSFGMQYPLTNDSVSQYLSNHSSEWRTL